MTDIVERLRDYAATGNRPSLWPHAMREAADEIEWLHAAVNRVIEDLEMAVFCDGYSRLRPCEPECHCVQHYDAVRALIR